MNMEVKGVEGDGYCFLNAVVKVLTTDYNEQIYKIPLPKKRRYGTNIG